MLITKSCQKSILFFTFFLLLYIFPGLLVVKASQNELSGYETILGQTKSVPPSNTNSDTTYVGFATRVRNNGTITKLEIYYVLSEASNLTCHIMDTDLNIIYSTPPQFKNSGHGIITFFINSLTVDNAEIYIALESDRQSLGLGTVQESQNVTNYVTSNNTIVGLENVQKNSLLDTWHKEHGQFESGISLYMTVYGSTCDTLYDRKNIYVSSSDGDDNNDGFSPDQALKSVSYALSLYPSNANIYLKSGEIFFEKNGLSLNGCSNLTLSSYGDTKLPILCGLQTTLLMNEDKNIYKFPISDDIGHLMLSNQIIWKRVMSNRTLQSDGEYYVNLADNLVTIYLSQKPNTNYISYANASHGISIKNCSNITISNIEISNYGKHGISISGNSSNICLLKNVIHDIGGATLSNVKYGNGIECWLNGLSNITIAQNTVFNCFDAGITPQIKDSKTYINTNILVTKNEIYNCTYPIEYFNSSPSNCQNIDFSSNYIHDCKDITEGYRENAATSYNAFFCMWRSNGNDSVTIDNNICINSDGSSISFLENSFGKISFSNNTFITNKENSIKNFDYFYGQNNRFLNTENSTSKRYINLTLSYYQDKGLALIR